MTFRYLVAVTLFAATLASCKKDKQDPTPTPTPTDSPRLVFKFKFDSTQQRLNNLGQPSSIPSGHAAQSPVFNTMSAHYFELAPDMYTALGTGEVLYKAAETTQGGSQAIDFSQATIAHQGDTAFSIPLDSVTPGSYQWLRVSLAYQNYDIKYKSSSFYGTGTIASFIGYNTFIGAYHINTQQQTVNANKAQGYWGFETYIPGLNQYYTQTGQAPPGATTVPNPLFNSSPIPSGSCVVTGAFDQPLVITGNETADVVVTISISTNNSFEWEDNGDGLFEPGAGDAVVDMGVRGMIPMIQ